METHQNEEGALGQPGTVKPYNSIRLTENETTNAVVLRSLNGDPNKLFLTSKRPNFFQVGTRLRFRNKMAEYGWVVLRQEPLDVVRTQIILSAPQRIYGKSRRQHV